MADDLYCKVYVAGLAGLAGAAGVSAAADGAALKAALTAAISAAFGQSFTRRRAQVGGLVVEVFDNTQRTASAVSAGAADFVHWPCYLEIEPVHEAMSQPAFIAALAALLKALHASGLRTVASCDFEDELALALQNLSRSPGPAA